MKRFILTVGPALLHEVPLTEVHEDRNIYRINGAHGSIEDIEKYILKIREQVSGADILMDLPGNKVRTKDLPNGGVTVEKGKTFELSSQCFNYPEFYKHLKPGMIAWANDSIFEFEVVSADSEKIVGIMNALGYKEVFTEIEADVIFFNTCAIRENAENRIYGELGRLKGLKSKNPDLLICLCGCMPQEEHVVDRLLEKYREINLIFGTHNIYKLPEFIYNFLSSVYFSSSMPLIYKKHS